MANSKYLNIDVEYSVLTMGSDGQVVEDVRFNHPAKDRDEYTNEGIYTFTVSNQYTDATTTKTIYVGTDAYLSALSNYEYTVEDLNAALSQGATVSDDGELIAAAEQTEYLPENEDVSEPETELDATAIPASEESTADSAEANGATEAPMDSNLSEPNSHYLVVAVIICLILIATAICIAIILKRKNVQDKEGMR